jgi:hypothetical protein
MSSMKIRTMLGGRRSAVLLPQDEEARAEDPVARPRPSVFRKSLRLGGTPYCYAQTGRVVKPKYLLPAVDPKVAGSITVAHPT